VLQDLDKSIQALLKTELPAELRNLVTITFAPPVDSHPANVTLPCISFFLSGLQENRDLRGGDVLRDKLEELRWELWVIAMARWSPRWRRTTVRTFAGDEREKKKCRRCH
jgi:hypothetical protein